LISRNPIGCNSGKLASRKGHSGAGTVRAIAGPAGRMVIRSGERDGGDDTATPNPSAE
jgi:hypothetical protein